MRQLVALLVATHVASAEPSPQIAAISATARANALRGDRGRGGPILGAGARRLVARLGQRDWARLASVLGGGERCAAARASVASARFTLGSRAAHRFTTFVGCSVAVMVRMLVVGMVGGCSTVSHVGNFVTDVNVTGGALVVTSCDVTVTVTNDWVNNSQSEHANTEGCTNDSLRLPATSALILGAPKECRASMAQWEEATTKVRRSLWPSFPRPCRVYLEEQAR